MVGPLEAASPGHHPLVAIVGPTASGKSGLAIRLATALGGEVVNFDSVQAYRGCDVGSGKLPPAERQGVPHHLIDIVEPGAALTAGDFRREGLQALDFLCQRGSLPVLVGGSGLYLRALLLGLFEGPPRSEELRQRLREVAGRRGGEFLHRMLGRKDAATAARIHCRDTQKITRALEVCLVAGRPFSDLLRQGRKGLGGFCVFKVGLNPPRPELYRRIDARAEQMFASGLVDEVRSVLARLGGANGPPLEALGYRQARALIEGKMTQDDAVRDTQTATRQYAKRQLTWFRKEADVRWFEGFGDDPGIDRQVLDWLKKTMAA
ncbi:MAG TPA: tRNA (adenosine(37)-N6)-dimethylallyltransferase MiaA [Terriglobia bacterium]